MSARPIAEPLKSEVGVRELHDHLSRYVQHVKDGGEVVVTMRGRRVARLVPVDKLILSQICGARGLVREPTAPRSPRARRARLKAAGPRRATRPAWDNALNAAARDGPAPGQRHCLSPTRGASRARRSMSPIGRQKST